MVRHGTDKDNFKILLYIYTTNVVFTAALTLLPDSGHSTYSFISTFAKDILSVLECYRP